MSEILDECGYQSHGIPNINGIYPRTHLLVYRLSYVHLSMKSGILRLTISLLFFGVFFSGYAQPSVLEGKKVGFFISSRNLTLDPTFNIKVTQFLKLGEDRSWAGVLKNEYIIRLGELFSQQLQDLSLADTVVFLNGSPQQGRAFISVYDTLNYLMRRPDPALNGLDYILVIDEFELRSRIHNSTYIRSNRVLNERIPVEVFRIQFTLLKVGERGFQQQAKVCYDKIRTKVDSFAFDLYYKESAHGKVLSRALTSWWIGWITGEDVSCK